jgi:two-component system response regulator GlrR
MAIEVPAGRSGTILVVDDDIDMQRLLAHWLRAAGHTVRTVSSGPEALTQVCIARPDLVITDLRMEGMDGMALASRLLADAPALPVLMLSGDAAIPDALAATRLGAAAFLTKPPTREALLAEVDRQLGLPQTEAARQGNFGTGFIHRSSAIAALLEEAALLAQGDISIMISGSTGTGKEVLARAIHAGSPRGDKSFIGINCGAIPEQLLESELFGHEKGAFTGATTRHEGLFVAADGGTLFLDEIGDMPLSLQVKLLRVLQDLEVRPVGALRGTPVDVRVISATHQDLEQLMLAGEFREDLYYRLNGVGLHIPALCERREDIPPLVAWFLARHAARTRTPLKRFGAEALELLVSAPWPGNARQLSNVVEQCATLAREELIPLALTLRALRGHAGQIQTLKEAREDFDRQYLISVMRLANGNVATAARLAGRNRTEFYKLLEQHRIEAAQFRSDLGS